MCGIIGYVGPSEAYPILLGGLGRLEYRGYDSAGVATIVHSRHAWKFAAPKASSETCAICWTTRRSRGHIGIGHTRWATHGRPSEDNAHPHKAGPVAVIHNGIVENFIDLRTELLARGHKLRSETDTELISHLIEEKLKTGVGLTEAVRAGSAAPARIVLDRRAVRDRARQARGRQDRDAAGAGPRRRRELHRVGHPRDSRAHPPRDRDGRRRAGRSHRRQRAPDEVRRHTRHARAPPHRMGRCRRDQGRLSHYLRKEISDQPQAWIDTMAGRADAGSTDSPLRSTT